MVSSHREKLATDTYCFCLWDLIEFLFAVGMFMNFLGVFIYTLPTVFCFFGGFNGPNYFFLEYITCGYLEAV